MSLEFREKPERPDYMASVAREEVERAIKESDNIKTFVEKVRAVPDFDSMYLMDNEGYKHGLPGIVNALESPTDFTQMQKRVPDWLLEMLESACLK